MPRSPLLILLPSLFFFPGCGGTPEWKEHSIEEGNFRVLFPGKPETKNDGNQLTVDAFGAGGELYQVIVSPSPAPTAEVVEKAAWVAIDRWGPQLSKQDKQSAPLENHPGVEIHLELKNGLAFRERYLLVGPNLVNLKLTGKTDRGLDHPHANQFFQSFALLKPVPAVPWTKSATTPAEKNKPGPDNLDLEATFQDLGGQLSIQKGPDGKITGVSLDNPIKPLTPIHWKILGNNPWLERLSLFKIKVESPGWTELGKLPRLQYLFVGEPGDWKESDYQGLGLLQGLRELIIIKSQLPRKALEEIGKITRLENLNLNFCRIAPGGLGELNYLTRVRWVSLLDTDVTDEGISQLRGLENMESLNLSGTLVQGPGLKGLHFPKRLNYLYLSRSKVNDAGLNAMPAFPEMSDLNLEQTEVGDEGLAALATMPRLIFLHLGQTKVTDQGLKSLGNLKHLATLNLQRCPTITDQGLIYLKELPLLRRLFVQNTSVTPAGIAALQKSLPQCIIDSKN